MDLTGHNILSARSQRKSSEHPSPDTADVRQLSRFSFARELLGSKPAWEALRETNHRIGSQEAWSFLTRDFRRLFGATHDDLAERLGALARSTIEALARSDALYHNYEHTFQVTLVGRDILQGMSLAHRIEPDDYAHLIVACLLHDIGYMRGALSGDTADEFVIDSSGNTIELPRGSSDAALSPYHVDRSKIFAYERLEKSPHIDAKRIADAIECTRFPPLPTKDTAELAKEPRLVQAADLIGQLGDPLYSKKANALYWEFEEIGMNRQLGYSSPADLIDRYPELLLEHGVRTSRRRDQVSQHDRLRPAVDRQSASPRALRRE